MSQLHKAESRVAYMRKPYGDCIRDHSRAEGHRAERRLSRTVVATELEAFYAEADDYGCDGHCDTCLGLPGRAISEDPGGRWCA